MAAIAAVLSAYDAEVVREVTSPFTGIQTAEKFRAFMPNVGELKACCDAVAVRHERMERLRGLPAPCYARHEQEAPDGSLAGVFVPKDHARYQALVDWAASARAKFWKYAKSSDGRDGIWVAYGAWDNNATFMRDARR